MPRLSHLHRLTLMMVDPSRLHRMTLMMTHPSHLTTKKIGLLSGLSHPHHQLVRDLVGLRYPQYRPHHGRLLCRLRENVYEHYVLVEDENFDGKQRKGKRRLESRK